MLKTKKNIKDYLSIFSFNSMIITKDIYWGVIKKYIPIGLFLFLIIITLVIPGWFISQEKYFYYWDYGGYQSVASYQVEKFSNSPLAVLRSTI